MFDSVLAEPDDEVGVTITDYRPLEVDEAFAEQVLYQQQPPLTPQRELQSPTPLSAPAQSFAESLFGQGVRRSSLGERATGRPVSGPGEAVSGGEANTRATTDTGSLLGKSPAALGVGVQRRTPIVNDPRVRGSRVGQLAASGSHWVPARIDLDTAVNKLDSHLIEQVNVINGPYSVMNGPGLHFISVDLLKSPRNADGWQWDASTSFSYKTNGQQIYAREDIAGGDKDRGLRVGYGYANGNSYRSGNGTLIPSGYTSQDLNLATGYDLSEDSAIEFNYLHVDQSNVQFPGQAFDIDALDTNALDVKYVLVNQPYFDRMTLDMWYNRTSFNGDAQHPGKRQTFPFLNVIQYVGYTNVDSISSGYTLATTWGKADEPQITVGTDLRVINQELNEIASGVVGLNVFRDANSPIPQSYTADPGIFMQDSLPVTDQLRLVAGARIDWVTADVTANPATYQKLGNVPPSQQSSLGAILGSNDFNQYFPLFSAYLTSTYQIDEHWSLLAGAGTGERHPSLTELYAAQPFMFLIQNGLNTVTGDPQLLPERILQADLTLTANYDRWQGSLNGYHAWALDYITFENIGVVRGPPDGNIQQTNLKYVNTDLATFAGAEAAVQYDWTDYLTPFGTLNYVDARDRTRNGEFATKPVSPGDPSVRVYGLPRGFFSGIAGAAEEPLPGIIPLQTRLGLRLHALKEPGKAVKQTPWALELSARTALSQNRIATSLIESRTPGFTVWDLRGYWQANRSVLLVGGIENFTNLNYREHLDYRSPDGISMFQPGINFYCGADIRY